jgi:hypothetical protein
MEQGDGGGSIGGFIGGVFGGIVTSVGGIMLLLYVGAVFALAGLFEFGVPLMIAAGAGAFALVGLSLFILTPALEMYFTAAGKILGIKSESGAVQGLPDVMAGFGTTIGGLSLLIGLGGTFALLGLASPLIGAGALAMWGAGQALFSISDGIVYYNDTVGNDKIEDNLKDNLMGIRDAFLGFVGGENKDGGVWGAIKGAASGVFTSVGLGAAIAAAMGIGPALTSIASGIGAWANLQNIPKIKGYDKMGQPIYDQSETADVETALDNLTEYLPGIVKPFIDISKQANMKKGTSLFSLISGADLGESPFEEGVRVAGQIGPTLSALAAGIAVYADLSQAPKITGYDAKGQPIYDKSITFNVLDAIPQISETLGEILKPFINLSKTANMSKSASLFSLISGADLGESPFEEGVRVTGMIGPTLSALAGGIGTYADLSQAPKIVGYDEKGQPIYSKDEVFDVLAAMPNITETLNEILVPFTTLANNAAVKKGTSLFSLISGADLGSSPFEMAVNLVGQMGPVLTSLAGGIGTFANLSQAPKIIGYDELGQPIYSENETFDILAGIAGMAQVIDPDSDSSMITPMIRLGEYLSASKPFSIGGFISEAITGVNPAPSPAEKGLVFALQIGRILSEIGNGLGVFVNLNNIPEIIKYNEEGAPVYSGKTVDSQKAIKNIGTVLGDIIKTISGSAKDLEKLGGGGFMGFGEGAASKGAKAIGPMVASLLNGISGSLEAFASPNNIRSVIGYDPATGKAKYDAKGVNIYKVVGTMDTVIRMIINTVAGKAEELEKLYYAGEGADAIGKLLNSFVKPIKSFAETMGIAKSTGGMTHVINVFSYGIRKLVNTVGDLYEEGKISSAESGTTDLETIAEMFNGKILDFIENMVEVDMMTYSVNTLLFFDSVKTMATINGADKKKRTFFAQFNDEITRLSSITSPFSKFVSEFGKFAKHMGTFKENFSFMDTDGIMAFEKWTAAVEHLVVTAEEAGVTSGGGMLNTVVEKTNDIVSTAFGSGGGGKGTDMSKGEKKDAITKANTPADKGGDKGGGNDMAKVVAAINKLEKSIAAMAFPKNVVTGNAIRITD